MPKKNQIKHYLCKFVLSVIGLLLIGNSYAESSSFEVGAYEYLGKHGVDFRTLTRGPLGLQVIKSDNHPELSDMLLVGLSEGFQQGGATFAIDGVQVMLAIELTSATINAEEVTIKATAKLIDLKNNKNLYQSTLSGKGRGENTQTAASVAVDKLVTSLYLDEYLLIEILD